MIYYTEDEFAKELSLHRWTVKKYRCKGRFPKPDSYLREFRGGAYTPLWTSATVQTFKKNYRTKINLEIVLGLAKYLNRLEIAKELNVPVKRIYFFFRYHKIEFIK